MIFKRKDGYPVKMDPLFKIIPLIMSERSDSMVSLSQEISLKELDEYIAKKRAKGINLSYIHIFYAALVRTLKEKPKLNQFIMNGRLYMRNDIEVCMMVKKSMSVDGEETSVKLVFEGDESPEDIKNILSKEITKEKNASNEDVNEMDKFVFLMDKLPQFILKFVIYLVKWADRHNLLPKSILNLSPFHASAFVTNVGSIGLDAIFHHIYNVGTIGTFLAIGKRKKIVVLDEDGKAKEERAITFAFVSDERISDGFYFAKAMKLFFKYLKKPELLEKND